MVATTKDLQSVYMFAEQQLLSGSCTGPWTSFMQHGVSVTRRQKWRKRTPLPCVLHCATWTTVRQDGPSMNSRRNSDGKTESNRIWSTPFARIHERSMMRNKFSTGSEKVRPMELGVGGSRLKRRATTSG